MKLISQVKAWLHKYACRYDSRVVVRSAGVYSSQKKEFSSRLTDHLKEKFGLEFVFFSGKEKDKPYGYAIIDHRNEAVYKGSDVLKLALLDALSSTKALGVTALEEERKPLIGVEAQVERENIAALAGGKAVSDNETFSVDSALEISLEGLQSLLNSHTGQDTGEKSPVIKRKRKRGGF